MLHNYFRTAVRHLLRHQGYAAINILGLAVAFSFCILVGRRQHLEADARIGREVFENLRDKYSPWYRLRLI